MEKDYGKDEHSTARILSVKKETRAAKEQKIEYLKEIAVVITTAMTLLMRRCLSSFRCPRMVILLPSLIYLPLATQMP